MPGARRARRRRRRAPSTAASAAARRRRGDAPGMASRLAPRPSTARRGRSRVSIVGHERPVPEGLDRARRLRRSALLAVVLACVAPGTAYAHTGGRIATDFEARVAGLRPRRRRGVRAQVLGGDLKLAAHRLGRRDVSSCSGCSASRSCASRRRASQANAASPTAWSTGVVASSTRSNPPTAPSGGRSRRDTPSPGTRTACARAPRARRRDDAAAGGGVVDPAARRRPPGRG